MEKYDVVIVGAGPAGTSICSEISSKLKILLIEKGVAGKTTKAWATWKENSKGIPITHKSKEGVFCSYKGASINVGGILVFTVDENKILKKWLDKCKKNKSKIIDNCNFQFYRSTAKGIVVKTSKGEFKAKLLIDATGADSPIVKKKFEHRDDHYWSCFGYVVDNVSLDPSRVLVLEDVLPEKPRPYFMYFPISKNKGVPIVFFLDNKKYSKDFMKEKFFEVVNSQEYKDKFKKAEYLEEKYGWIPLRKNPIYNLDNVLIVGDAGGWTPPLTGCGFNMILEKYREVSKNILKVFETNDFSSKNLNNIFKLTRTEQENYLLQSIFYFIVISASDELLNKAISLGNRVNIKCRGNIIKSHLTSEEIKESVLLISKEIDLEPFISALPKKEYLFVLKLLEEEGEDLIISEAKKIFHKFTG